MKYLLTTLTTIMAFGMLTVSLPVLAQDACEGQVGSAFGFCNAYCEAMDCDSDDPQASDNACDKVLNQFEQTTGSLPPCESITVVKDSDGDGLTADADYCPGTVIPEAAPTHELHTNNFALVDGDGIFDTKPPNGNGPQASFDVFDTAGCSCEQIGVELGLGKGHLKFGCSLSKMNEWVEWVNLP